MKLGMVGLPNVGKSTLFNALAGGKAESANYPFCTIEPNVGVVSVPDARLDCLAQMYHPDKFTPAVLEFVDIAGLVEGASKGEGLGNQFLANIREVDAIIHVVRCFEDDNVVHVSGGIDPVRDAEIINLELIFADLDLLVRRIDKLKKKAKASAQFVDELTLLKRLKDWLEQGKSARCFACGEDEREMINSLGLLCAKPMIYAANLSEDDYMHGLKEQPHLQKISEYADKENHVVFPICAKIEQDIADMDCDDQAMFLNELGLKQSGLSRMIQTSYHLLGLISYLTAGKPEVRAWTIKEGTCAPQAAGKIHSDFERGFICAEVIGFDDLMACGSLAAAKEKGLVRQEGKNYVMKDGDVVLFRFNV